MMEYIISYAIKAVVIYWYYTWALQKNFSLLALIVQIVAIWWLLDNIVAPLFNQDDRDAFFKKIFSVDVLNLCLSIYYLFAGVCMYFLFGYWRDLDAAWKKIGALGVFMIAFNRAYFAILNMTNKDLSEGFCKHALFRAARNA